MAQLAPYLVLAWLPIGMFLFVRLPRAVAVLAIALLGSLFLPEIQWAPVQPGAPGPFRLPMIEPTKVNMISYTLLACWLIFDGGRRDHIRFHWADLPTLGMVVITAGSCILNGQNSNDTFFEFRSSFLIWGVPYLIGRLYLGGGDGLRLATAALAIGGLLYIPFCLLEVRISPQLHNMAFGFQQHSFLQTVRLGGYRPMVFLQHGLAVGIFMSVATLCLFWLWWSRVWPLPSLPALLRNWPLLTVAALAGATLLCKSFGALALCGAAIGSLLVGERMRTSLLVWGMLMVPPAYVFARSTGMLPADTIVQLIGRQVDAERSESFEYRIINEDKFMEAMGGNKITGMGGGGKMHPRDHIGRPLIADGLWIITFFASGWVGLIALVGFFFVPAARFLSLCPSESWSHPSVAPAAAAAVVLAVLMIDCLLNSMLIPPYIMLAGGLNGWCDGVIAWRARAGEPT